MAITLDELGNQTSSLQKTAKDLVSRFDQLNTFEQGAQWKSDAMVVCNLFEKYRECLENYIKSEDLELHSAKTQRESSPTFKKLFSSRKTENEHRDNIAQANTGISSVDKAVAFLSDRIDQIPTSKAEQKEMLADLRLVKREITTKKRSVNEVMREIRTSARQRTASLSGAGRGGFVGKLAYYDRARIRRNKEAALSPHENTKAELEKELIDLDKRINHLSRYKGDDFKEEAEIQYCAYCGRRVTIGVPCPGCGSTDTTKL